MVVVVVTKKSLRHSIAMLHLRNLQSHLLVNFVRVAIVVVDRIYRLRVARPFVTEENLKSNLLQINHFPNCYLVELNFGG